MQLILFFLFYFFLGGGDPWRALCAAPERLLEISGDAHDAASRARAGALYVLRSRIVLVKLVNWGVPCMCCAAYVVGRGLSILLQNCTSKASKLGCALYVLRSVCCWAWPLYSALDFVYILRFASYFLHVFFFVRRSSSRYCAVRETN